MFNRLESLLLSGPLVEGLPVLPNTMIILELQPDKFKLKALTGRNKDEWPAFELTLDKVENVQIVQKRETKEVTEQSAAGMIVGAALFGNLGARIGGRAKTKEKIQLSNLFIIDYVSDENKQIILDVSTDLKNAEKVVKQFKTLRPETNTTINTPIQL